MITATFDDVELFLEVHHFLHFSLRLWQWWSEVWALKWLIYYNLFTTAHCIFQYLTVFLLTYLFCFFLWISHQWAPVMCWWSQLGILQWPEPLMLFRSCGAPASLQISPTMSHRWAACLIPSFSVKFSCKLSNLCLQSVLLTKCIVFNLEWSVERFSFHLTYKLFACINDIFYMMKTRHFSCTFMY